ncbi:MAG TPA: hypothetical protein VHF89_13125 [Solirubrobacteraceae bacterium]|nr:hypothetical protein [Solirubrobacteraceae bacterium]
MRWWSPRGAVLAVAVLAPLATAAAASAPDAPPSRTVPHARAAWLSCGDLAFRPAALRRPRGFERRRGALPRALRRFLRRSADAVAQPRSGWFLLARRRGMAEVAAGRLPELGHMTFRREDGRWRWFNSGSCFPRTRHAGLDAVTWRRRQRREPPPADATRIPVLVQEDECASGRDARGRILPPLVHYGRRTVTVTYFVRPRSGAQNCQGVPPTPATLVLDEPLGGRSLRDGGPYPPRRRR